MANIKFSQFTADGNIDGGSVTAKTGSETSFLVGYDSTGSTNNMWTFPQVAEGLSAVTATPFSIYAANGTIATSRVATITDTPKFQGDESTNIGLEINNQYNSSMNPASGGAKILLSSGTSGVTTLELRANRTGDGGSNASQTQINSSGTLVFNATNTIGWMYQFKTGSLATLSYYGTSSGSTLRIGSNGGATPNRIDLGWDGSDSGYIGVTGNTIGLGNNSGGTLTENLTILSGGDVGIGQTSPTEKLEVAGNVKITGQAYTELHTGVTPLDPNWNNGNVQESTLTSGSSDFDPTNPKAGATYILKLTQPASGAAGTVNWDNIGAANIKWPGGTEPTLTATNGAVDIITLICTDSTGQGVYYGNATLDMQ
jgi:hypothetical protein